MSADTSAASASSQVWRRPVPVIGDTTSAHERASAPDGWAFPMESVAALDEIIAGRRDIRRFRPDPVPEDLVRQVVQAGHLGPSVGHSQPWRFIVVGDPALRDRAAALADALRLEQAAGFVPDRAQRLLDLKLEGLREAPLGIVVACDRRTPAAGVLGRATFPDADLWSCACAIENMWLAARARGLGMGWVTLFRPGDLAGLLDLPEGVETLGWLCLGWPDERPPEPGLQRLAWSKRLPLDDVLLRDRWPSGDGSDVPAPPTNHLRSPDQSRTVAATDAADDLLSPPGSLGVLDRALDRLVAAGCGDASTGTLLLVGADHAVADLGVSAYPASVTREVLTAAVAGEALGVVAATGAGLAPLVVDAGVRGGAVPGAEVVRPYAAGSGDLAHGDPLTLDEVDTLLARGRALGARAVRSVTAGADAPAHDTGAAAPAPGTGTAESTGATAPGLVALGEVGVGNTTVAAALTAALLEVDADEVTGLGAGSDTPMVERKRAVVTAALGRVLGDRGADTARSVPEPRELLARLGGAEFAVLTGAVIGAAEAGGVVVLDGLATSVAALLARRLEPGVHGYLVAGQRSRERAHELVLRELGLEPLLTLRLRAGEGVGACLAAGLLLQGLRMRRLTARTR